MIIVLKAQSNEQDIQEITQLIHSKGLTEHISRGQECTIIGAVGDERVFDVAEFERLPQVERAIRIVQDWRMISREAWADDTVFTVRGVKLGGENVKFGVSGFSGSLKTENTVPNQSPNQSQLVLLDPFFIPNNPYVVRSDNLSSDNVGQSTHNLKAQIQAIHDAEKLAIVRIRDSQHIGIALSVQADLLYLGGEMIENVHLLRELGLLNTPVVICKAKHHTVRDWLMAAEQIVLQGNQQVILGESGTINLNNPSQLRLDVDSIAQAKKLSHLPILADISQLSHKYLDQSTLIQLAQASGANLIICQ